MASKRLLTREEKYCLHVKPIKGFWNKLLSDDVPLCTLKKGHKGRHMHYDYEGGFYSSAWENE